MPDGSPTRFWHQVRDQALHLVYGGFAGLLAPTWVIAVMVAGFYAAVREGEQWRVLNTPTVADAAMDWAFCVAGALLAFWVKGLF